MRKIVIIFIILCPFVFPSYTFSQDDLEKMLEQDNNTKEYTTATFKTSRVINGQSNELVPQGNLEFRISHRFGLVKDGFKQFFGLYSSSTRIGLEYSPYKVFMVGLGINSNKKCFDGFLKVHLARQSKGKKHFPLSITLFTSMAYSNADWNYTGMKDYKANRLSYCYQLIIARKFSERISLQISPTLIHRNLVSSALDVNNMPAFGFAGRIKLTNRIALCAEYFLRILAKRRSASDKTYYDTFAVGFDIDTGGHIFQLHFTNATSLIETGFIPETYDKWWNGQIRLGFNLNRQFNVHK